MKFGYFFEDLLQEAKGRPMSPEKFEAISQNIGRWMYNYFVNHPVQLSRIPYFSELREYARNYDSTTGADVDDIGTMSSILTSFTCEGMVDLDCYQGVGSSFTKLPNDNACNKNDGGIVVKNGCYVLVNKAFTTLFGKNNDFNLLAEWVARFRLTFAICRGVFSHTFVNAWVNGSVFAFPFKSKVYKPPSVSLSVPTIILFEGSVGFIQIEGSSVS